MRQRQPPWNKPNPKTQSGQRSHPLSPRQKAAARAQAKRAPRPYPFLSTTCTRTVRARLVSPVGDDL